MIALFQILSTCWRENKSNVKQKFFWSILGGVAIIKMDQYYTQMLCFSAKVILRIIWQLEDIHLKVLLKVEVVKVKVTLLRCSGKSWGPFLSLCTIWPLFITEDVAKGFCMPVIQWWLWHGYHYTCICLAKNVHRGGGCLSICLFLIWSFSILPS